MLPLPNIANMRAVANQFMTEPVSIAQTTITYDQYGQQSVGVSTTWSGLGYVGGISGKDREMLTQLAQYLGGRDGTEFKYFSTILLPFETTIDETDIIRANGFDWEVVWHGNDTQNTVQLYTKLIVRKKFYKDTKDIVTIPVPPVLTAILPGMRMGAFSVPPTYTVRYDG